LIIQYTKLFGCIYVVIKFIVSLGETLNINEFDIIKMTYKKYCQHKFT